MIAFSSRGAANNTLGAPSHADQTHGPERVDPPARLGPTSPRNRPVRTLPCVIRVIDGVGVAVFPGQEYLLDDVYRQAGAA